MKITIRKAKIKDIPAIQRIGHNAEELWDSRRMKFYYREELKNWIKNSRYEKSYPVSVAGG